MESPPFFERPTYEIPKHQVDVEILSKQKAAPPLVKYHSQANISFTNVPSQDSSGYVAGLSSWFTTHNFLFQLEGFVQAEVRCAWCDAQPDQEEPAGEQAREDQRLHQVGVCCLGI